MTAWLAGLTTGQLLCLLGLGWLLVSIPVGMAVGRVLGAVTDRRVRSWDEHVASLPVPVVDREREVQQLERIWADS